MSLVLAKSQYMPRVRRQRCSALSPCRSCASCSTSFLGAPRPLTSCVGNTQEKDAFARLLTDSSARLKFAHVTATHRPGSQQQIRMLHGQVNPYRTRIDSACVHGNGGCSWGSPLLSMSCHMASPLIKLPDGTWMYATC